MREVPLIPTAVEKASVMLQLCVEPDPVRPQLMVRIAKSGREPWRRITPRRARELAALLLQGAAEVDPADARPIGGQADGE